MTLRIFLSHSHQDNPWCDEFVAELSKYDLDIWYDRQGLYAGDEWFWKIQEELSNRDIFIVIITPASVASTWVKREIAAAFNLNKKITGIVQQQASLPPFLATIQTLNAQGQTATNAARATANSLRLTIKQQVTQNREPTIDITGDWGEVFSDGTHNVLGWHLTISQKGTQLTGKARESLFYNDDELVGNIDGDNNIHLQLRDNLSGRNICILELRPQYTQVFGTKLTGTTKHPTHSKDSSTQPHTIFLWKEEK